MEENINSKKYWKGFEELTNDIEFVKRVDEEFGIPQPEEIQKEAEGTNRRDFLKLLGFSVAAASLASCETPVKKAIPYLNKPVDIEPSIPNYYASTYMQDGEYCSIVVKTREGRPIKIEGNPLSSVSKGGTSARVQASVLNLYDNTRLQSFKKGKDEISHQQADKEITEKLQALAAEGKAIRIVSHTIMSPSTKSVIDKFIEKYPTTKLIQYDAVSAYGMLKANELTFDKFELPSYNFNKAKAIVSIGADFLGTWLSSIEYAKQYTANRKLGKDKKTMSKHYQFETGMSLTGANADYRIPIKPSQEGLVAVLLYNELADLSGKEKFAVSNLPTKKIKEAAKELYNNKGKSLVVSGSNDVHVQIVINAINNLLGNYSSTIDFTYSSNLKAGNDESMDQFINELAAGKIGGVLFYGVNPVYDHPRSKDIAKGLKNTSLSLSFSEREDETAAQCNYICTDHHYLESWNDAQAVRSKYSLVQPTISPLFDTRQAQDSLLKWSGYSKSYYDYIRSYWRKNIFGLGLDFEKSWMNALHQGIEEEQEVTAVEMPAFKIAKLDGAVEQIKKVYRADNNKLELSLYQKTGIGSGAHANNPWLQELPDAITKATWDNYLCISQSYAKANDLKQGDVVKLSTKAYSIEIPVLIQPGQAKDTCSLAIGYGRTHAGKCANGVGKNAYPFMSIYGGVKMNSVFEVSLSKTSKKEKIAQTQTHHTIMGRPIIQESTLKEYQKNPKAGRYFPIVMTSEGPKKPTEITLWNGHEYPNHSWGMVIDLNSCIGCGSCVVACQSENNIPVVGKEEVLNRREMHWIRIDRYYSTDADTEDKSVSGLREMEEAGENPEVVFQPMLCQHCNNAPCETVCPVLATTHSTEGLNQMAYNRCIGTRYCANNCPYKVRRFNWFNYNNDERFTNVNFQTQSDLGKMVLNPDVTVRSRGVMEKCSFCVQRIQAGKLEAKKDKRKIKDGEIKTACQQSCPADAIVFGDMKDQDSEIVKLLDLKFDDEGIVKMMEPRAYHVLEEINVRPQVSYLTKIRNKE